MDSSIPGSTNSTLSTSLTPVFGDNVQDLLGTGTLNVNPSAIITVNSIDDALDDPNSGVTTLRDAINQANGDTGEDLIVFDRSLFSNAQTIGLNLGELDLTHNLDIIAPRDSLTGADLVTVSGNKTSRVFEIEEGAAVTLSGLIEADGKATNENGAGIKNSGILTLDSSIVRSNFATSTTTGSDITNVNGGGIYNNGVLTVSNSTISDNSIITSSGSDLGGGIYNSGTVVVNNSTISGNMASSCGGIYNSGTVLISDSTISSNYAQLGMSGGIYNSGTVLISDSTISSNYAKRDGGGILNDNGANLTVRNCTISRNDSKVGFGGGIYNSGNTLEVSNSTISNNGAGAGGGIYNSNSGDTVDVNNSTISSNYAMQGGGIDNFGIMNVSNSTISGNSATYGGGGISNGGTMNVSNSTLSGNSLLGGGGAFSRPQDNGGGIDNFGTLSLVFSTLTLNESLDGGGVFNFPGSNFSRPGSISVRNTIIAANLTTKDGVNPDVSGTFNSNGYNLIGDSTGSTGFDATGDIVGTSDNPIDPRLAPLDFYGGSTQTIALLPDSPAISAGDPTVLDTDPTTDQRGLPRRASDGSADIGAFEFSS